MKPLLTAILLLIPLLISGQRLYEKLQEHQAAYALEKVYISQNQPYYAPGDTLYGTVFLVDGRTHQYFVGSPIVYVDILQADGEKIDSNLVKIQDGKANLSISIPSETPAGIYHLRAYTRYQKNFDQAYIFQKELKIIGEKTLTPKERIGDITDFKVQFFPEGGRLVNGLNSTIAFKALNGKGRSIEITGEILDETNQPIAKIKSINEGMGIFHLKPQPNKRYQAKINWNGLIRFFDLPKALEAGWVLKANSRLSNKLVIDIASNAPDGLIGCTLIGHLRGQPFLEQVFTEGDHKKMTFEKSEIPSGLLHLTLFDNQERPVCERLIYNHNAESAVKLNIDIPQSTYRSKELVSGKISTPSTNKFINGDMTITVYNKSVFPEGTSGINLKNYLLLQSDLKGRIPNINQYFEEDNVQSRTLLDYVLLTHGWRRFNWQDIQAAKLPNLLYPAEENISIAGKVKKDNKSEKSVKADIFLNVLDDAQFSALTVTTEEDGLFYFKNLDLPKATEIMIQGSVHNPRKKKKLKKGESKRVGNKYVQFELFNLHEIPFDPSITMNEVDDKKAEQALFAKNVQQIRKIDTIYHPEWTINLDAATVSASRIDAKRIREKETKELFKQRGFFYSADSDKIYLKDLPGEGAIYTNVFEIIRNRVPGARIVNTTNGKQVVLRAQSSINIPTYAAFELDGFLVSPISIEALDPNNVEMIDVKRGLSSASIYGEAGKGGVISIVSKTGAQLNGTTPKRGVLSVQHPGYHQARTFYTPDYTSSEWDQNKPDFRTTLYWNGAAQLTGEPTLFQFYTGDKFSEFLIFVEGVTEEGVPFTGQQTIKVNNN